VYLRHSNTRASWPGREGPVPGIVTRINRKSVTVPDEDGATQYTELNS
jgi:hypothetical protein